MSLKVAVFFGEVEVDVNNWKSYPYPRNITNPGKREVRFYHWLFDGARA
jgi:hypothetical protein